MGLFGDSDENDEDASYRGGFEEKDVLELSGRERVIDEEAGVVIYGFKRGTQHTITSVPLKDTMLDLPDESERLEDQEE